MNMLARIAPISPVTCPCCGQAVARPDWAMFYLTLELGPMEARMLQRLAQDFGRWVTLERLITFIWADDVDGGPENTRVGISVLRIRLNGKLAASDFVVEGRNWRGWRLSWRARAA